MATSRRHGTASHDRLIRLRELQDRDGRFPDAFIPLAFHPDNTKLAHIPKPSGIMDLKTMAVSRLMLDNFGHIKAYWVMLGIKTAQGGVEFPGGRPGRHSGPTRRFTTTRGRIRRRS